MDKENKQIFWGKYDSVANISLRAESDYVMKGSIVSNNTLAPNNVFAIQLKHEINEKGILL